MDALLAIPVGIGLAAACGFRVFLPLLILSLAARTGIVEPGSSMAWVGSWPALLALSTATCVEIGAYYIPWVDHALDVLATPLAALAGALAASVAILPADANLGLGGWAWAPALLGGSVTAGGVQLATVAARATSTATTGGLANPLLATLENIGAALLSIMAILAPIVGLGMLLVALFLARRWFFKRGGKAAHAGIPGLGTLPHQSPRRRFRPWSLLMPWRWFAWRPWGSRFAKAAVPGSPATA